MNKKPDAFHLGALFASKRATAILSIVLAVFTWMIVITVVSPESTRSIPIPVDFAYNEAVYISQGLSIVEKPSQTVTVYLKGDGSVLGSLSQNDILVYPDYSIVKGAGTYTLKLEAKNANSKKFDITGASGTYVELTFDKLVTQKFSVTVNGTGIQPADGYYMDLPLVAPTEVTLTGPEKAMSRVEKVVANVELKEERTESAIVTAKLQYLDKDGKVVEDPDIKADSDQVEVTIPIYKIKELPLTVEYTSVPTGFNPAVLNATLSEKTIRVAGPAAQLDGMTSISAGIVDLAAFKLGEDITANVEMPEGLRNVDGLQSVTIHFATEGYTTKTVTVTELRTINVAEGVTVSFPNERVNSVVLVGEQKELDELSATGVVAQVDASPSNLAVSKGQQNIPVQIVVPSAKTVFAIGSYTILCDVETKAAASSASTAAKT
ncbi:MAG: CdaR family protein [Ruthenibacterium sp.]